MFTTDAVPFAPPDGRLLLAEPLAGDDDPAGYALGRLVPADALTVRVEVAADNRAVTASGRTPPTCSTAADDPDDVYADTEVLLG